MSQAPAPTIVVVGGGCTGAIVAHQLARRAPGAFRIVVVEPRPQIGTGVAYSTEDPAHRINVPASRMSFVPSDPCHFDRWLDADGELDRDPDMLDAEGRPFPKRSVFGRYGAATVAPYVASGAIEHARDRASGVIVKDGGFSVLLASGSVIAADALVLATTHPAPDAPAALAPLLDDRRLIRDTQTPDALTAIDPDARVLIVGTGLTMADIVASLDARGHRGPIVAVSRRGLLSRNHSATAEEFGDFVDPPIRSARTLVRRIRSTITRAEALGRPWQHVLDAVRVQAPTIWRALPVHERRRVAVRLRPFWDVHRFRVAPQIAAAIERRRKAGAFRSVAAALVRAEAGDREIVVTIRPRGAPEERIPADVALLATGPAHGSLIRSNGFVAALADAGLVRGDEVGLGLAVDDDSRAVGDEGLPAARLWIAGPLARGAFGELMGLPEAARHAEIVAGSVLRAFAADEVERDVA